ncbi:MAG: response regulator [Anaerolineaceae bacterium]|nr:response regulator [Anaerolineaceae bacterium]
MDEAKPTILVVEDDLDIADMLNAYFRVQGYDVLTVNWGEDGVRAAQTSNPGLVILDIRLPDIDGFEVARRLRSNRRTKEIPIIFLTEKRERSDRLRGLELQADDYITKPFDIQELRLRVRNAMQRSRQGSLTNPVTEMPEGSLVDETLAANLKRSDVVMQVVSLKNLDRFREVYGFVATDDLLRAVSLMIRDALRDLGTGEEFVGHITNSDFVIITRPTQAAALKDRINKRLEQSFDYFYSDQDREMGTFRNRRLALTINEVVPSAGKFADAAQLREALEHYCH